MVIADNLSQIVTPVFNDVASFNSLELLLAGFLFFARILGFLARIFVKSNIFVSTLAI
jgi:hypothetical protein